MDTRSVAVEGTSYKKPTEVCDYCDQPEAPKNKIHTCRIGGVTYRMHRDCQGRARNDLGIKSSRRV